MTMQGKGQQSQTSGIASGATQPMSALGPGHSVAAAPPTDQMFPGVFDGWVHVDTANNKIWARVGGVWKGASLS